MSLKNSFFTFFVKKARRSYSLRLLPLLGLMLLSCTVARTNSGLKQHAKSVHNKSIKVVSPKHKPGTQFPIISSHSTNKTSPTVLQPKVKEIKGPVELGFLKQDGYRVLPVILYHDITYLPKINTEVSYEDFYRQMKYLSDEGYKTITTEQMYNFLNISGGRLPEKAVLISFDNGYKSVYYLVQEIFKEFGFRGVIFIYTDAIDKEYSSSMSWKQIKELSDGIFDVQAHTKTNGEHIGWRRNSETDASYKNRMHAELWESKRLIEAKIEKRANFIAYPYGRYSDELIDILKNKYGYKGGFSVIGSKGKNNSTVKYGYTPFFNNPFKVRRLQIFRDTPFKKFKKYLKTFKKEDSLDREELNRFKGKTAK